MDADAKATPIDSARQFKRVIVIVGVALYVCALPLPAFHEAPQDVEVQYSYSLLMIGWMGILVGYVAWFANPVVWLSWVLLLRGKWFVATVSALVATVLISRFHATTQMSWPLCEHQCNPYITGWGSGYWLWLASAVWTLALSVIGMLFYLRKSSVVEAVDTE